jgi:transcriptional adapter 2-alpha
VGYIPKRGDFDFECDPDAEYLLVDLEFFSDDNEEDIKYKDEVINIYNWRLDERISRKKFVIERGFLDFKKSSKGAEKKKTKEEREIVNAMKIFARFNPPEDHERLVASLIKEK